jgi:hypothetical protein
MPCVGEHIVVRLTYEVLLETVTLIVWPYLMLLGAAVIDGRALL